MKRLFRRLGSSLGVLVVVTLLVVMGIPAIPAFALTTADVAVNATPSYVAITCNFTALGYSFGTVVVSTNYSSAQSQFGITNTSSVVTNQTISVTGATWTGGTPWTHSDTGTPGADTVALFASAGDNSFSVIVKNSGPLEIVHNQGATTNYVFELRLSSPSSFSDGTLKSNTLRITAVAA